MCKIPKLRKRIHRKTPYRPHLPVTDLPLRPYQESLLNYLKNDPADHHFNRQILFIVDPIGDQGKSWFSEWYFDKYHRQPKPDLAGNPTLKTEFVQIQEPGKKADVAQAVSEDTTVMFFDATRQQIDCIQYSTLEALKNKRIFSSKYESTMKRLSPMHIIVMMNEMPGFAKTLSKDRFHTWRFNPDHTRTVLSDDEISQHWNDAQSEVENEKELKLKRELQQLRNATVYPPFRTRDDY